MATSSLRVTFSDDNTTTTDKRRPSRPSIARRRTLSKKSSSLLSPAWQSDVKRQEIPIPRRQSKVGRDHFLRSFGRDTLHSYQGVDGVLPEKTDDLSTKTNVLESIKEKNQSENVDSSKQSDDADKGLIRASTAKTRSDSEWLYRNVLADRGKDYSAFNNNLTVESLKEQIRSQSAKRRIRRTMLADKEKADAARKAKKDQQNARRKTLKGTALSLLAFKVTSGTFDMFVEKKKWLAETRMRKANLAKKRFIRAVIVVQALCKFLKVLKSCSSQKTPMTAAQKAWHALKHTSEAKEILFNMTIFQKGKSQYAYVPEWVKNILAKSPMERSDLDLSQLHAVLKGLQSYDKFTYRIQMVMCRAMTYQRFEHGRTILRKGHEGQAFYFVFSGSAFVNVEELLIRSGHVVWHTAVVLHRGDSFGELALLRRIKRTASVVVREDIELLAVDRDVFAITCPKIYDKELGDKIMFCKNMKIFQYWTDDMLRNICFEAQIQDVSMSRRFTYSLYNVRRRRFVQQSMMGVVVLLLCQWKSNRIIVRDSSKDTEWLYICMQGKCSVIKALELRCPPRLFEPEKVNFEEAFLLFGRGSRPSVSMSSSWKKELEETFKQPYSFANQDKTVDEHESEPEEIESEIESDSEAEAKRAKNKRSNPGRQSFVTKEQMIKVMDLSYSEMPHAKGNSKYCEVDDEEKPLVTSQEAKNELDKSQIVLEKRMELNSLTLLDLMRLTNESGRLNNDVVFLDIARLQSGDIFDLSEVLMPTGRKLMLISNGAILLRIKRADYMRYSTKTTIKCARDVALQTKYPSDEMIYRSYNDRCAWDNVKRKQLYSTMVGVQDAYVRHDRAIELGAKYNGKPLKSVKGIVRKEEEKQMKLAELDEYLEFIYGPNKAEHN